MRPSIRELVVEPMERLEGLDSLGRKLQSLVGRTIPQGSRRKDLLSGTWLGHPLHPLLTDVVVGTWTSAWLLDLVGGKKAAAASDRLIGIGILSTLPTAAAGLSDWADTAPRERRIGLAHASGNSAALAMYALSWIARKRGRRGLGVLLSTFGAGAATASAYLGGHLSYGKGVGVNQTAFERLPRQWTAVALEGPLEEGRAVAGRAGDVQVMLFNRGGEVLALLDRCSHRGCPIHDGEVDAETVTCPCHGSTFRLEDGAVLGGPATSPQPALQARVREGTIEVRARS